LGSEQGGLKGVVQNMKREGEITNFWLVVPGAEKPSFYCVEANAGNVAVEEGDTVFVRGAPGGDGILRTAEVKNLSRGASHGEIPFRRTPSSGRVEIKGTVIGDMYQIGGLTRQGPVGKVGFRVQCFDKDGNPQDIIEVEAKARKIAGFLSERDSIFVSGKWEKGRVQAKYIRNLTTKTDVAGKSPKGMQKT
jgi:hypothetical protein